MIVISGCPRSGTSMMTLLTKELLASSGYEVIGDEFPMKNRLAVDSGLTKKPSESDAQFSLRKWSHDQNISKMKDNVKERKDARSRRISEEFEKTKSMNPMGFWECRYTVRGTGWHIKLEDEVAGKKIMKIVSQGLNQTPPHLLDKVIYMLRHPRKVATSQEALKRGTLDSILELDNNFRVNDTLMFCQVTLAAARYFKKTGVKPLIVEYDDFLLDPDSGIARIIEYLGAGDADCARRVVNQKLKRSEPSDYTDETFEEAEALYECIKKSDWDNALKTPMLATVKKTISFPCPRINGSTVVSHCRECKTNPVFMLQLKAFSVSQGIEWHKIPCSYDCGYDPDRTDHISVEESIKNNHWKLESEVF